MLQQKSLFVFAGFLLIATTYGLARFAWGLLLPAVMHDVSLSPAQAGVLSSGSFAAYCVAIIFSSLFTQRIGPRPVAVLAGVMAAAGMSIIALSSSMASFLLGMICSGISTGLASPPMAEAVDRKFNQQQRPVVNTLINAGTSAGIILSSLAVLFIGTNWRVTYFLFALFTLVPTVLIGLTVQAGKPGNRFTLQHALTPLLSPAMRRPLFIAAVSGIVSAAYWTFGPTLFQTLSKIDNREMSFLWMVTGIAGCSGMFTGVLLNSIGINHTQRLVQSLTIIAFLLLALIPLNPIVPFVVASFYGAAYITLSGTLLVSGVAASPSSPAAGLGAVFLMLAVGQAVGASLFGIFYDRMGATIALSLFSAIAIIAGMVKLEKMPS